MNNAAAKIRAASGLASPAWLAENLGAEWLRVLDVRSPATVRDDRSGTRLRVDDDPPRFVEVGPRAGWLRAGEWPSLEQARAPYLRGHIAGSTFIDVGARLFDAEGSLVWGPELAMVMSEAGVSDGHTVVLIDDSRPAAALALEWALRRYGHADTLLLEGGYPRWVAEGRPVTQSIVKHPFGSFTAKTLSV